MKGKGEKERYTQLNAEFHRGRGDLKKNKSLLTEQCKKIEEKNRKGNTRDFFNKIGYNKGIFHARMNMIKDRNGKDQIKKRWQEYTEL